jgi:hypothetical protein
VSEHARAIIELIRRNWAELNDAERGVFDDWLRHATGADLYMLLRFAWRRWRRPRTSSSQTMQAIFETTDTTEGDPT